MKKYLFFFMAILLASVLVFSSTLRSVQAYQPHDNPGPSSTPTTVVVQNPGIADGDWSSGGEVISDLDDIKAPKSYLQLLGDGVKVDKNGKICHPFRGGQYGWTGSIYQLVNGNWKKVTTYFAWVPNTEGTFMACTYGYTGGIYALFGVYTDKVNPTATFRPTITPTKTATPKPTDKPKLEPTSMPRQ